jgi:hypothetical protein
MTFREVQLHEILDVLRLWRRRGAPSDRTADGGGLHDGPRLSKPSSLASTVWTRRRPVGWERAKSRANEVLL